MALPHYLKSSLITNVILTTTRISFKVSPGSWKRQDVAPSRTLAHLRRRRH